MTALSYISSARRQFQYYKLLGEKAIGQLKDDQLFFQPGTESNSIAVIVKHMWGNMLSRWTNFLTKDGEKEWRKRDEEFENDLQNKAEIMQKWEEGWQCLFAALEQIDDQSIGRIIYIRKEGHTVLEAINRQLAHYSYHIGQIVFLAKMLRDTEWNSLSIPRNQSETYNREKCSQEKR